MIHLIQKPSILLVSFGEDEDEKIDIRSGVAKTGRWSNKISPLADSVRHSMLRVRSMSIGGSWYNLRS